MNHEAAAVIAVAYSAGAFISRSVYLATGGYQWHITPAHLLV